MQAWATGPSRGIEPPPRAAATRVEREPLYLASGVFDLTYLPLSAEPGRGSQARPGRAERSEPRGGVAFTLSSVMVVGWDFPHR